MIDLEIPLKTRSKAYRFFEMLPGIISWGSIILLIVLSLWNPLWAGIYVLLIIVTVLTKAIGIGYHTLVGSNRLTKAQKVDWHARLTDLADPESSYARIHANPTRELGQKQHAENLR